MKKIAGCIPILMLLLISCRSEFKNEVEETAYWQAKVLKPASDTLYKTKNLPLALSVFDSLLNEINQSSPIVESGRYVISANYYYFFTPDNYETGLRIDSAMAIFNTKKLQEHYPRSYVSLLLFGGEIAFRLSDYIKANQYYFTAKQLADRYLNSCESSSFSYNMGMVSYRQQNFQQSAQYFKQAYASQATCAAQTRAVILQQQEIQSNIGLCLVKLKQYDSALFHFNKALEIARKGKDSLGAITVDIIHGVVYGNIAKIYVATNRLATAEKLFKKSIALNARPGYEVRDAMLAQVQLAEVYSRRKELPAMFSLLQSVRTGLDTIPDAEAEMNWQRLMSSFYREKNEPTEELRYFKGYMHLSDSLEESKERLVEADIARQLKEKEQQLQIALLKKNNLISLVSLWVVIALSLMAVIIIFLIYQNYRRSKKSVAALTLLNQRVYEQKAELETANKEKDRILHVVAHDLRNPIGITAYVSDLILMEEQRSEEEKVSLQMIKEASQQALHLTNELLGFSDGKVNRINFQETDLVGVIKNTTQLLTYKAAEKGQVIKLNASEQNIAIQSDPERLNRMFSNLVVNAIKFSPLQGEIKISVVKNKNRALVTVADEGIGIPKEQQAFVFDRFTAARRKGTNGERSFGLGLSICKEIVEEHGGVIQFESSEGKGTSFHISLPLADNA